MEFRIQGQGRDFKLIGQLCKPLVYRQTAKIKIPTPSTTERPLALKLPMSNLGGLLLVLLLGLLRLLLLLGRLRNAGPGSAGSMESWTASSATTFEVLPEDSFQKLNS